VLKFIARRLAESIPVLFLTSLIAFSLMYLVPGDPIDAMMGVSSAGEIGAARPEIVAQIREDMGLNDPLLIQYARWTFNALRGDFGDSYVQRRSVVSLIVERLPSTVELALASTLIVAVLGLGLGIIAAVKSNTPIDGCILVFSLGGISMPNFWFGIILILAFSVFLGVLPATGSGGWKHLLLPAVALGYEGIALITRLMRASLLEVLGREYITTAQSKGLSNWVVIMRHAMRNAMIPVVTMLGIQCGRLLAGAVVIETVFARRGIGQLAIDAIKTKDFPLVQGTIFLSAALFLLINLLVDISYGFLDPQLRVS
jgi:peptide/nickel transport system permease protein